MVIVGSKHFYVFEFARLVTGEYVVPKRWVRYKSEMHGEVFKVTFDNSGIASIDDSTTVRVKITDLHDTFLDLVANGTVPRCNGGTSNLTRDIPCTNHHLRDVGHEIRKCDAKPRSNPRGW